MKTVQDVKDFLEANKELPPIEKYMKWMTDNGAIKIKIVNGIKNEYIVPDKKDALDEVENKNTFTNYQFFQKLWDDCMTHFAKKEYAEKMRLTELEQTMPLDDFIKEAVANF